VIFIINGTKHAITLIFQMGKQDIEGKKS